MGYLEGAALDHLRGGAAQPDVLLPKDGPGHVALLEAQDEQLDGPEQGPAAVGQVQHAVGLVPAKVVLDVRGQLGLHAKRDERQDEEDGGVGVSFAGGEAGVGRGAAGAERGSAGEGGSSRGAGGAGRVSRDGAGAGCREQWGEPAVLVGSAAVKGIGVEGEVAGGLWCVGVSLFVLSGMFG